MDNLIARLRLASVGLCSEDGRKYIPRGISAADCVEVADHIQSIEEENKRLREALADIEHPMRSLQRQADETGRKLSREAYSIAHDIHFLRRIARETLSHTIVGEGSDHD